VPNDMLVKLKKLYEQLAKAHLDSKLYGWNIDAAVGFDKNSVVEVLASVEQTGPKTFEADSPWAAAIFLIEKQARQGFLNISEAEVGEWFQTKNFKTIFRGQSAKDDDNIDPSEWRHQEASLSRQKIAAERLHNWQGAFCLLLKLIAESDASLSIHSLMYFAAAQHYGIPTDFLDWTVDPCIAVWFAHPGNKAKRSGKGVVFFTELELQQKMELLLPPPFVHRLYRQRGLFNFTESQEANTGLYSECFKIYFPLDKEFALPRALQISAQQMLAADPFLTELVREAHGIANGATIECDYFDFLRQPGIDETELQDKVDAATLFLRPTIDKLTKKHQFSKMRWERIKAHWFHRVEQYIGWLCMFDSFSQMHLTSAPSISRLVERNRDALFLYAHSIMATGDVEKLGARSLFIKPLYKELTNRHPHLVKSAESYRVPLIVTEGVIQVIAPS